MFNLKKLRRHLNRGNCLKLANALVFSHMDYCNSLFVNLPKETLKSFQRIQNFTAKMILGESKFSSSTNALRQLHILPINVRSEYKILLIVYKCLHGLAPAYLRDLLEVKCCHYNTRSAAKNLLVVPFTRRKIFADRSFSVAGPKLWNALPEEVKFSVNVDLFKKNLKTYLFTRTFGNA